MLRPTVIHRRHLLGPIALAGFVAILARGGPARGDDLSREMSVVATQVKLFLEQKGFESVAVGEFRGPARLASSSGPSIAKSLSDALNGMGVVVRRKAELEINGEYRDVEDRASKQIAVQIKAHVIDHNGAEVLAFEPRGLFNIAAIAALTGVSVTLPPEASEKERSQAFADAIDAPKVQVEGSRVSAGPSSPYAIEILVKDGNKLIPRAATRDGDGFAFARIRRDEAYAIQLINDSPYDAAVTLTIDGLSVFAFSENKAYTHWIVASKGKLTVPGWHRSNAVADSFVVTEYAKSAVAEGLPNSSNVGTITATFAAAWPKGGSPPPDEPSFKKGARSVDATGQGPPVKTGFVDVIRETGLVRSAVSLRYAKEGPARDLSPTRKP